MLGLTCCVLLYFLDTHREGEIETDEIEYTHMTVQYFCCYTRDQYVKIASIIQATPWRPQNVTFSRVNLSPPHHHHHLPVVWDAYGAAAEGACHVLKIGVEKLSHKYAFEGPNWAAASPAAFYKQLLSVKLQKGSARIVRVVRSQWV